MALRDIGVAIVRRLPWLGTAARFLYRMLPAGLHDHPADHVRRLLRGEERIALMQIGAFDGIAGDPVRPLLAAHPGWTGVLLEPQPGAFQRLARTYAGDAHRIVLLNAAISDRPGTLPLHVVPEDEVVRHGLPDWSREIASFDPAHLRHHFPQVRLETRAVEAVTFAQAAERLPGGRVDLVVIDAEGHESTILPSIDLDRHQVRVLVFEHKHIDAAARQAIAARLRRHGFTLKPYGRDTVAWRGPPGRP